MPFAQNGMAKGPNGDEYSLMNSFKTLMYAIPESLQSLEYLKMSVLTFTRLFSIVRAASSSKS